MKRTSNAMWLVSALVLLSGCGSGVRTSPPVSGPPSGSATGPPNQSQNIASNWQFTTESTVPGGIPPATIAGSIIQSGSSLTSAIHVDGWDCFDQRTTISLSGPLTDGDLSMASASVDGQILTFAGSISKKDGFPYTLAGTYAVNGGCGDGYQGSVIGVGVDSLKGNWAGNLTTAGGGTIHWDTQFAQDSASSEGSFGLTGKFTFDDACFKSGTISAGMFPTTSFIMGRSVNLGIKTDNGTITFLGTAAPDGLIRGNYTVSGGPCELSGTGYLSPWEY
jgi:hypothetical protein